MRYCLNNHLPNGKAALQSSVKKRDEQRFCRNRKKGLALFAQSAIITASQNTNGTKGSRTCKSTAAPFRYANGLKDAFVENCEANGIEVAYVGECMTTDTDYSSQAAQAVASGADLLYYPCFLDTVPLLVGAARNAGFTGAIMGGDGWDGSDTTGLAAQFEDCYFTNHYSSEDTAPAVQNFVAKYTEKYGTESLNACAALYYDAMYMLVQAAENAGGTDTASLVKGMTGMSFTGVGGDITLDENGDAIKSIAINTYIDGEVKWTETLGSDGTVVSKAE